MTSHAKYREVPWATNQGALDAPLHMVDEVCPGSLHASAKSAMWDAQASSGIRAKIASEHCFGNGGPGGWWNFDEPERHPSEDTAVSDFGGWRRETMPECLDAANFRISPDCLCEVLSPSTRPLGVNEERAPYARKSCRDPWFVDPDARSLESYELDEVQRQQPNTFVEDLALTLFTSKPSSSHSALYSRRSSESQEGWMYTLDMAVPTSLTLRSLRESPRPSKASKLPKLPGNVVTNNSSATETSQKQSGIFLW